MKLKCFPAGNLVDYVENKKDFRGKKREDDPVWLQGDRQGIKALLHAQAPPFVHDADKHRRKVRQLRRHLVHLIACFSETQPVVERVLPTVIEYTERLFLAGMPRGALAFLWCEHPQDIGTHAHGGLVRALLPSVKERAGCYTPNLSGELRLCFERLLSHKLGLSDPLDPNRLPAVMGCWASWKTPAVPFIRQVVDGAHQQLRESRITGTEGFKRWLTEDLKFTLLACPGEDGRPARVDGTRSDLKVPLYYGVISTLAPDGQTIVCFSGGLCRHNFDLAQWRGKVDERRVLVDQLRQSPAAHQELYTKFEGLIKDRIDRQKDWGIPSPRPAVRLEDFEYLRSDPEPALSPEARATALGPETYAIQVMDPPGPWPPFADNPLLYGPDITYPYETDTDLPVPEGRLGGMSVRRVRGEILVTDITSPLLSCPQDLLDQDLPSDPPGPEDSPKPIVPLMAGTWRLLRQRPKKSLARRRHEVLLEINMGATPAQKQELSVGKELVEKQGSPAAAHPENPAEQKHGQKPIAEPKPHQKEPRGGHTQAPSPKPENPPELPSGGSMGIDIS